MEFQKGLRLYDGKITPLPISCSLQALLEFCTIFSLVSCIISGPIGEQFDCKKISTEGGFIRSIWLKASATTFAFQMKRISQNILILVFLGLNSAKTLVNVNSLTVNHVPKKLHDTDPEITLGELGIQFLIFNFTVDGDVDDFLVKDNSSMILRYPIHTNDDVETTKLNRHEINFERPMEKKKKVINTGIMVAFMAGPCSSAFLGQMTHLVPKSDSVPTRFIQSSNFEFAIMLFFLAQNYALLPDPYNLLGYGNSYPLNFQAFEAVTIFLNTSG
ncbi:hypothetical protein Tco_0549269 [Tanacetum coccineum]